MKRKFFVLALWISMSTLIHAQQTDRTVISPAGTSEAGTALTLDWTLGELAVQSREITNVLVTEGFQQPTLLVETVTETTELFLNGKINLRVGPNPTSDNLYVKINSELEGKGVLSLKTLNGQHLQNETIDLSSEDHELNLDKYPGGLYFLSLYTEKGELLKSFKITKLH